MGIASYYYVPISDDLIYSLPYRDYINGVQDFPGLQPWKDFFMHHYLQLNGRFGDKLIVLLMLVPRGWYGMLFGSTFFLILLVSSRLTRTDGWSGIILYSMIVLIIPSYETIFARVIYLNYMVACMLSLWWIYWFIRKRKPTTIKIIGLFLYSILMGSWHELFTVSLIFGSLLLMCNESSYRDRTHLLMSGGLLLGFAFIVLSKGNYIRTELLEPGSSFNWIDCLAGIWLGLITIAVYIWTYIRYPFRFNRQEVLVFIAFIFIVLFAFGINYAHRATPRHGWLVNVYGLLLLFVLGNKFCSIRRSTKIKFGLILVVIAIINLLSTIYWQRLIWHEQEYLIKEFKKKNGATIYYDFGVPKVAHLLTLGKIEWFVYYELEANCRGIFFLDEEKEMKVVPTELRNVDELALNPIEDGLYLTPERNIISRRHLQVISREIVKVEGKEVLTVAVPFQSENGKHWVYYRPFYEYWNIRAWTDNLLP